MSVPDPRRVTDSCCTPCSLGDLSLCGLLSLRARPPLPRRQSLERYVMTKLADVAFDDARDAAADARLSIRSRALASLLTPAARDVNRLPLSG